MRGKHLVGRPENLEKKTQLMQTERNRVGPDGEAVVEGNKQQRRRKKERR